MKYKVLIVIPSICRNGGGVSEATRMLANEIALSDQFTVEVTTLKSNFYTEDRNHWIGMSIRAFNYYGPTKYGFSPGLLWHILKSQPDIIHVHGLWMFHCLAVLIKYIFCHTPYIITPHGMLEKWILNRSPNLKKIVSLIYQKYFINKAKAIHVLTEKEIEDVKLSGYFHNNIVKIPNFVEINNTCNFSYPPKWWTPEMNNKRVYLYFGRIHEKKGWRELCAAWNIICSNDKLFKNTSFLLFAGWIDDCDDFIQICSKLSIKFNNTQFIGAKYATERTEVFAFSDIFILPSKSEGLPMVVLEAWSSRLFTILTRDCNLPDGFEYGAALETGQSSAEICNSLKIVSELSNHQLQTAKEAAYQLATSKFSKSAVMGKFLSLYQCLLHKGFNNVHTA